MRRLFTCLALLSLAACVVPREEDSTRSPKDLPSLAAQKDQPLLALADHLQATYFASDVVSQPIVCLAVNDGREDAALPPEDERALMMRHVHLSPMSRCVRNGLSVVDSDTGAPALVFTLHSFTCADASHCTGFTGFNAGNQQSLSSLYRMSWDGAAWQFAADRRLLGSQ